jgi:hypothetical protein
MSGVSPKTVSRALNDEPHVSARVRQLVKEAAAKLDYHPNLTAQSLIARRSFLIGLTYERPSPSYVVDLQNGALDRMQSGRYRLIVLPFSRVSERLEELGRLLLSAGLDGFCSRRLRATSSNCSTCWIDKGCPMRGSRHKRRWSGELSSPWTKWPQPMPLPPMCWNWAIAASASFWAIPRTRPAWRVWKAIAAPLPNMARRWMKT